MENQVIRTKKYQSVYEEMTDVEYNAKRRLVLDIPLSESARFQLDSRGYYFTDRNDNYLNKWEVYAMGFTRFASILKGTTPIKAVKK